MTDGRATGAEAARGAVSHFDVLLDPVTGDFVDDGAGAIVVTTTSETAVVLQLLTHYQGWWGDPEAGSRLHDLEQFQSDPGPLIEDETRRALGVLVAAGRIADVDAKAVESQAGRVDASTSFRDVKTGSAVVLAVPASGG